MIKKQVCFSWLFLVLLLFVPGLPVLAATPTTVSGVVMDASQQPPVPLAGALVTVDTDPNTVVTQADGVFIFDDISISGDNCRFIVTKSGYAWFNEYQSDILEEQTTYKSVSIYTGALIYGKVTAIGPPVVDVAGTTIKADTEGYNQTSWLSMFTAGDGTYSLRLPPGKGYVQAEHQDYAGPMVENIAYITDGAVYNVDFEFYTGAMVSGVVYYADTTVTVANALVVATPSGYEDSQGLTSTTGTAADGSYLLSHVYPGTGSVDIVVTPLTGFSKGYRYFVPVQDQQLTANVNFRLDAGGDLWGYVTDYQGLPVYRARVSALPMSGNINKQEKVDTDVDGSYLLGGLAEEQYAVTVEPRQGQNLQIVQVSGVDVVANTVTVRNFTLQPGGSVYGYVHGVQGNTVTGAKVRATLDLYYPFGDAIDINTDSTGFYELDGLSPYASYTISIRMNESPNTINAIDKETGVAVSEGERIELNFNLPLGAKCSGTIKDYTGTAVPRYMVVLVKSGEGIGDAFEDETYAIKGISEGNYVMMIEPMETNEGISCQRSESYIKVTPLAQINTDIVLAQGGEIEGKVYKYDSLGNTSPAIDVQVYAWNNLDTFAFVPDFVNSAFTDSDGNYKIRNVETAAYRVVAVPFIMDVDGWSCQNQTVNVTAGSTAQQNFYLPRNGNHVFGTVRNQLGNRIPGQYVFAWNQSGYLAMTIADYWGNYDLMLPSGSYYAQTSSMAFFGANLAVDAEQDFFVENGKVQQLDFIMQSGGAVSGVVHDQLGQTIALSIVGVYQASSPLPINYALTDDQGEYYIPGLSTGEYTLQASAVGYSLTTKTIEVTIGSELAGQEVVLIQQSSIAGTVTEKNGRRIKGAILQAIDQTNGEVVLQTQTGSNQEQAGNYILSPLSGGPFQVKMIAIGAKSQTRADLYPGDRADFIIEPLIGKEEAISFPNPARGDTVKFLYWLEEDATVLIRVYSQSGELVWDWEGPGYGPQHNQHIWQVSGVAPGVYIFRVTARKHDASSIAFPVGRLTIIK
jgi:carboxypeptidase family protein